MKIRRIESNLVEIHQYFRDSCHLFAEIIAHDTLF